MSLTLLAIVGYVILVVVSIWSLSKAKECRKDIRKVSVSEESEEDYKSRKKWKSC